MKILKRFLLVILVLIVLLVGAAFAAPYFFKDEIMATAKKAINENVHAIVDFSDVNISLFRDFPHLTVGLEDLTVDGIDPFEEIRLASLAEFAISLDIMSVIREEEPIHVRSIALQKPEFRVYVLQDGTTNYDIVKASDDTEASADTASSDPTSFELNLSSISISEGFILYDDRPSAVYLKANDLNFSGSGNLSASVYDLATDLEIGDLTFRQDGTTYLNHANTSLEAVFHIDQTTNTYTLVENDLRINAMRLLADGSVEMPNEEDILLDLKVEAPRNDFKNLLSLIPNAYTSDFDDIAATGQFALQASTKGTYNAQREQYPPFQVLLQVQDGYVKYPDLPMPVENIQADIAVHSPASDLDQMKIDINRFAMKVGDNPFEARLKLRTPISNPAVVGQVKGVIDLEALAKAYPMEDMDNIAGRITADIEAKASMAQIDAGAYEDVEMKGQLQAEGIRYQTSDMPLVVVEQMGMQFSPRFVSIDDFTMQLGKSDLRGAGRIDNILAYFSPDKTMKGRLRLRSDYFDANEWAETSEPVDTQQMKVEALNAEAEVEAEEDTELFNRFDFALDAAFKSLEYDAYQVKDLVAVGQFSPDRMKVDQLSARIGDSDISSSGELRHVWDYLFADQVLTGKLKLRSNRINLNEFMEEEGETTSDNESQAEAEDTEPILVPANLNLEIDSRINRVDYTNMVLNDLNGSLLVKDRMVILNEVRANTLGGQVGVTGGYDTREPDTPRFDIKLDLQNMNFQDAFYTFNTFEKLAPIGQFIKGKFNTSMLMNGGMDAQMNPLLSTLYAEGFLQTIDAVIRQFKPLQAIGNALNVQELSSSIPVQDTKNWFEVKNGRVEVKPFDFNVKDIKMNVSGVHGLNMDMDYDIQAKIPYEMLEKNALGAAASQGFSQLQNEAAKLGIQLDKGEFVDVAIGLGGSLTNPKVSFKLLGTDGQANLGDMVKDKLNQEVEKKKDELQAEAEQKLQEGKDLAKEKVDEAVDTAKALVDEQVDKAKEEIKKKAEETLKDELGKQVGDKIGDELGSQVDSLLNKGKTKETIKDELDKWNPFKNKKKKKKKDGN